MGTKREEVWQRCTVEERFIDPLWFRGIQGKDNLAQVTAPGVITLNGKRLLFSAQDIALNIGTQVIVQVRRNLAFISVRGKQLLDEQAAQGHEVEISARNARLNQLREEAQIANAAIALPVRWEPAIKPVISGLSEASAGNGANRSTVTHIRLIDPLARGRLYRNAGDMLCSTNGHNGSFADLEAGDMRIDGEGNTYPAKITCKKCLQIAKGGQLWKST